jgi:hypothetical protein
MKAALRKYLFETFKPAFEQQHPQFHLSDDEQDFKAWVWRLAPDLLFFVTVQCREDEDFFDEDSFTMEIAWSETTSKRDETLHLGPTYY